MFFGACKEMLLQIAQLCQPRRDPAAAGLAAPQVLVGGRISLAAVGPPPDDDPPLPIEFFITPHLIAVSRKTADSWEGCLSFPELLVRVTRPRSVRVEFL